MPSIDILLFIYEYFKKHKKLTLWPKLVNREEILRQLQSLTQVPQPQLSSQKFGEPDK